MKINYILQSLFHLRQGTLPEYLHQELGQYLKRRYYRIRQKRIKSWESKFGKQEKVEIAIQPDVQMQLYLDSDLCRLIYYGGFEDQERHFLNTFLKPEDIFVDIGANIGLFTLTAAYRVGKAGYVYAFEPCSKTYQRLLENIKLNYLSNVSCHNLALSDKNQPLNMTLSLDGFDAWNSLAKPIKGNLLGVETINAITWDSFGKEHNLFGRVAMMKIDVEGWEKYVLAGGVETFIRMDAPVLQVEFTEKASQSAGSSCRDLYHALENFGYQMFIYDAKSRQLIPDPIRESYPYLNLIATKTPETVIDRIKRGYKPRWIR